jgi:Rps23 Pro-64 3,4-dihydroxylase Tpa1-like proline 4-hydroxylase
LAEYPGNGAGYVRHYDVPRGKSEVSRSKRRLTCIFYANLDWKEEDGGHLKLYIPNTSNPEEFHLISPIANRLVIFQSEYFAHEVCPSFASRYAITLWMH